MLFTIPSPLTSNRLATASKANADPTIPDFGSELVAPVDISADLDGNRYPQQKLPFAQGVTDLSSLLSNSLLSLTSSSVFLAQLYGQMLSSALLPSTTAARKSKNIPSNNNAAENTASSYGQNNYIDTQESRLNIVL